MKYATIALLLGIMDFVGGTAQIFLFLGKSKTFSQHANPILGAFEHCDSPEVKVATRVQMMVSHLSVEKPIFVAHSQPPTDLGT